MLLLIFKKDLNVTEYLKNYFCSTKVHKTSSPFNIDYWNRIFLVFNYTNSIQPRLQNTFILLPTKCSYLLMLHNVWSIKMLLYPWKCFTERANFCRLYENILQSGKNAGLILLGASKSIYKWVILESGEPSAIFWLWVRAAERRPGAMQLHTQTFSYFHCISEPLHKRVVFVGRKTKTGYGNTRIVELL